MAFQLKAAQICGLYVPLTPQEYAKKTTGIGRVFHIWCNNRQSESEAIMCKDGRGRKQKSRENFLVHFRIQSAALPLENTLSIGVLFANLV